MRVTLERLKEVVSYDPETGAFKWNKMLSSKCTIGKTAGSVSSHGYSQIMLDGINYRAHRLAWLYMTGDYPKDQIDHINGNRSDNRWCNLRASTNKMNMENLRKANKNNKSGLLGVHFLKSGKGSKRWMAEIMLSGKHKFLGYFYTPQEAHAAYLSAKRELHEGCTL